MKIKVIGDIHGKDTWKKYNNFNDCDIIVFLGDYVDSFYESNETIYNNLEEIIQFKKDNKNKVILLLGNHDNQYLYLYDSKYRCSGFRAEAANDLHCLLKDNSKLFVNSYQFNNWIFTHAGIRDNWFKNVYKGDITKNIAEQLNNPKSREQLRDLNNCGWYRGGWDQEGGIFWADKKEMNKPLKNFNQVVGHTELKELKIEKNDKYNSIVYFADCLDNYEEPLIINIDERFNKI